VPPLTLLQLGLLQAMRTGAAVSTAPSSRSCSDRALRLAWLLDCAAVFKAARAWNAAPPTTAKSSPYCDSCVACCPACGVSTPLLPSQARQVLSSEGMRDLAVLLGPGVMPNRNLLL
jgi:hypothetical protein